MLLNIISKEDNVAFSEWMCRVPSIIIETRKIIIIINMQARYTLKTPTFKKDWMVETK